MGLKLKRFDQQRLTEHNKLTLRLALTRDDVERIMDRIMLMSRGLEPIEPSPCPWCGTVGDAATGAWGRPKPGDWTLCVRCAGVTVLDESLRLRKPSATQYAELSAERRQDLDTVQAALRSAILSGERIVPDAS